MQGESGACEGGRPIPPPSPRSHPHRSPSPCPMPMHPNVPCPHRRTCLDLPAGAYKQFIRLGLDKSYLGGWMQQLGYSTTLLGKFLNEFDCEYPGSRHGAQPGRARLDSLGLPSPGPPSASPTKVETNYNPALGRNTVCQPRPPTQQPQCPEP